jgi:tetratricopeptide (TPR) repeat protein
MALTLFWSRRGQTGEGRRWLESALARGKGTSTPERAAALVSDGQLAAHDGDLAAARRALEESVAIYRTLDDASGLCRGLGALASVLVTSGAYAEAERFGAEALALARELGDWQRTTAALGIVAVATLTRGDHAGAERIMEERLAICREHESLGDLVITLLHLSACAGRLGRLEDAEARLDEAEAVAAREGFAMHALYARGQRGVIAIWRGDAAAAVALHKEVLAAFWEQQYDFGIAGALEDVACSLGLSGRYAEAIRAAGAAMAMRERMGVAVTAEGRADLERYVGRGREALGDAAAAALEAEGRAMSPADAVAAALAAR